MFVELEEVIPVVPQQGRFDFLDLGYEDFSQLLEYRLIIL